MCIFLERKSRLPKALVVELHFTVVQICRQLGRQTYINFFKTTTTTTTKERNTIGWESSLPSKTTGMIVNGSVGPCHPHHRHAYPYQTAIRPWLVHDVTVTILLLPQQCHHRDFCTLATQVLYSHAQINGPLTRPFSSRFWFQGRGLQKMQLEALQLPRLPWRLFRGVKES